VKGPQAKSLPARNSLPGLFFLLLVVTVVLRRTGGPPLHAVLAGARPSWLAVAGAAQVLFLLNQAAFYERLYRVVGLVYPFGRLLRTTLAAAALAAGPGGSLAGSALLCYDGIGSGASTQAVLMVTFLYYLLDYGAFLLVLIIAGLEALRGGLVTGRTFLPALPLAGLVLFQALLLYSLVRRYTQLLAFAARVTALLRRLPPRAAFERVAERVERLLPWLSELRETVKALRHRPALLVWPVLHALLVEVLSIATLAATFAAFREPLPLDRFLVGYAAGMLAMIVSVTPGGLGVAEGVMVAVYHALGIPLATATLVTLVFRGITFWLPVAGGFLLLAGVGK